MAAVFSETWQFPRELRMGHYRGLGQMNTESAIADIFKSLTVGAVDWFGGTSSFAKEKQAEAALAASQAQMTQAQIYGQQEFERSKTTRTLIWVGGGIAAVFLLVSLTRRPAVKVKTKVSGYRKRRSRR
jgi:hypothetical protein